MTEVDDLTAFSRNIQQDVIARADAAEDGALRGEAFAELMFECLSEVGEIDDGIVCSFEARGMRCSGYYLSENTDRLDLFLTIPRLGGTAGSIPKSEVDTAFKRLSAFLQQALNGLYEVLEEALDSYDMALSIWQARDDLSHVRLFIVTDAIARIERIENREIQGIEVSNHLWDLRRIHRSISSGVGHEPIHIDFAEMHGEPIRCIVSQPANTCYRCLLAVIPGSLIVDMYRKFGPRLLERNVRSFLQLRGKVNRGIRNTILEEPHMFLAFNNGLSVTASGLKIESQSNGIVDLIAAEDFQIVNGGQTTGSIFRASLKDDADLTQVQVPVKITEILSSGDVETIASNISQSANNQNRVNVADFSSNHAFHRKMEDLSRSIWAPPASGMQKQSRWFYERARGQYYDALSQFQTTPKRKAYEATHPRRQVIDKTHLAKFEHTWSQLPHIVSRGAQKCYLDFMDVLGRRGNFLPDENFFKRVVARAILFKETERIVSRRKFGGYRANIVTYTLAWLSHKTAKRIDLEAIWRNQSLSPTLESFIDTICVHAHEHITCAPGGQNVTEWCKKDSCWDKFRAFEIEIPAAVENELISRDISISSKNDHALDEQTTAEESRSINLVAKVPADTWFGLAAWAKDTQSLQPWQRSISFSLGKLAKRGKPPSRKQAAQGEIILSEARTLGFRG